MATGRKWVLSDLFRFMMAAALLVSLASAAITCPPKDQQRQEPTLEEIHYYSDVVVTGKVTERYYPQAPGSASHNPDVYTAEMEVYCVYKGDKVPARINITNAGKPPNLCFSTDFQVGVSYMAYLKKIGNGKLIPAYPQHPASYKDEMTIICDINITLPVGLSKLPEGVKCMEEQDYDYLDYGDGEGATRNDTCLSFKPKEDETYKTKESKSEDGEVNDNGSGNVPLRMSLLLLVLGPLVIWVFS